MSYDVIAPSEWEAVIGWLIMVFGTLALLGVAAFIRKKIGRYFPCRFHEFEGDTWEQLHCAKCGISRRDYVEGIVHHERKANIYADFSLHVMDDVLVLIDKDTGGRSLTNDIDNVVRTLIKDNPDYSAKKIIYRDSMGIFDQVIHSDGQFKRFKSLGQLTDLNDALKKCANNQL